MGGEAVVVVVRMRPFNTKEKDEGRGPCISLDLKTAQVHLPHRTLLSPFSSDHVTARRRFTKVGIMNPAKMDAPPKSFTFDAVYDIDTQQKDFYETSCYPLIESVLDG